MSNPMSLRSRRELANSIRERYATASRAQKATILDEFTAATGYGRKHAIAVLRRPPPPDPLAVPNRQRARLYTDDVREALVTVWEASNRLCSKRLVPYLPTFLKALERFGHLELDPETRRLLLGLSAATVDRLLYQQRHGSPRSLSTTRPGPLLKNQIPIRTFTDWNDDRVGFLEADSVAHCGTSMAGTFINSLVLTDVKTGWTECKALLYKDQDFVVQALSEVRDRLPFPILGLDTDNGSEFVTNKLIGFCEREAITFTRSRPYKKNDQCFVEQKNGQIVRRLVGYDRYEGLEAARVLAELYEVVRLYAGFFQPLMRLVAKSRLGAKTKRLYDVARTPYDRMLEAKEVSRASKAQLRRQYRSLEPVQLLNAIGRLQDELWPLGYRELPSRRGLGRTDPVELVSIEPPSADPPAAEEAIRTFHKTRRPHKKHKKHKPYVHWWRTYPDEFAPVWSECEEELKRQPNLSAAALLRRLQVRHPGQYKDSQLRTLQRRVRAWRLAQMKEPASPRLWGDSLPEEHEVELVVSYPTRTVSKPPSVRF